MHRNAFKWIFWICLALALGALAALGLVDAYLKTRASPMGVVSFELCAYTQSCAAIVASWQGVAQPMAGMSLGLDYLFMLTYPAAICFGLLLTSTLVPSWLQRTTVVAAYISWLAGAADAVENFHLFQMLVGAEESLHAWPASIAASIKFSVLIPTVALLLFNYLAFGITARSATMASKQ
jgi:hypothetical protein